MWLRQFITDIRALAVAVPHLISEFIAMNATVTEIQSDLADDTAALEALKTQVDALMALTAQLSAQLLALSQQAAVTPAQLNALRDGLNSAKTQIMNETAAVQASINADTPTPVVPQTANAFATPPATVVSAPVTPSHD